MNQSVNQAIREMAKSVSGGHAAVAAVLGYTKPALENRLYEVKGQRIGIDEAMLIQRISGRTDFAEAVASESGGVFVALPEEANCAALAEEEISMRFLNVMEHGGEMVRKWRESTADGEVTEAELSALLAVFRRCVAEQAAVIELTRRYFCREDGACDAG
ncbi:YmfL family putative regulatory protein [Neisseria elongata]|uniref:YmfL family putative regulatory protein n=1 Tax=Neisseria elongata TaxID=495 RepID=UPI000A92414D|nr:YmfL family putative regulatory protein [Neisseria elongata]